MNTRQKNVAVGTTAAMVVVIIGIAAAIAFGGVNQGNWLAAKKCSAGEDAASTGCIVQIVPLSNPDRFDELMIKKLVAEEVQRRELASVIRVDVVAPGMARAAFSGGTAEVRYGFIDLLGCPMEKQRECEKEALANPLGFKVGTYTKHPG